MLLIANIAIICYPLVMNVSLTPQLEKFIARKVPEGTYPTASEVVREALRLLADREQRRSLELQRLRDDLRLGLDDIGSGRASDLDMRRTKAEGRKQLAARKLRRAG